jgi:hypothetical protein
MKRRKYGEEDSSSSEIRTPSWLQGQGVTDFVRTRSQDIDSGNVQQRRPALEHDSTTGPVRRRYRRPTTSDESYSQTDCDTQPGTTGRMDGRVETKVTARINFEAIREALSDDDLLQLLKRTYIPTKTVSVSQEIQRTKFAEDFYLEDSIAKIAKRKRRIVKQTIPPSEQFRAQVESCRQDGAEITAETVLGYYFILYKKFFHEEDPEWAGGKLHRAIQIVEKLALDTGGDYRKLVIFVKKIMPLWVGQLKQETDFPGRRPTISTLFGNSRYFWTNRNILYRKWQEK